MEEIYFTIWHIFREKTTNRDKIMLIIDKNLRKSTKKIDQISYQAKIGRSVGLHTSSGQPTQYIPSWCSI